MMLNIGQLLDDAKYVRQTLVDLYGETSTYAETMDNIIAYFEERYVPPSEPGSYKDTRGITGWQPGDEPAEVSIRRARGDVIESGVNIDTRFEGGTSYDDRPAPPEPTPAEYPPGYTLK